MKTRVISGIIAALLLIGVILLDKSVLGAVIAVISMIGLHEFYAASSQINIKPIKIFGYLSGLAFIPMIFDILPAFEKMMNISSSKILLISIFMVFIYIVALLLIMLFSRGKYTFLDVSVTLLGVLYVVFPLSFIVLTRGMQGGIFLVWFIFIGAFITDTFAYFAGVLFGRNKIIPDISPKKTLEGSIGGVLGCILITMSYGMAISYFAHIEIPIYLIVVMGAFNSIFSQIGDWVASAIKRMVNIKDYGNIMPGHGGVLDRFDSILFIAPFVYLFLNLMLY